MFRPSVAAALGCTFGIVPAAIASIVGLAALLYTSAVALLNALNPKLSLFFLAFLPQFVSPDAVNAMSSLIVLAGVFMAMTFIVFVAYGAFASLAREYVIRRPAVMRWITLAFAGTFGFLAMRLAVAER